MKKIKFLIICLLISFIFSNFIKVHAEKVDLIDLSSIKVNITGSTKSDIDLSFTTDEELLDLSITIKYYIDGIESSHVIYGNMASENCEVKASGTFVDGKYLYSFVLKSYAKISTFALQFDYKDGIKEHRQYLYITNGNPNISENIFTIKNAVIIGVLASFLAASATFIIIKSSEKNVQIADEYDEE